MMIALSEEEGGRGAVGKMVDEAMRLPAAATSFPSFSLTAGES